MATSSSNYYKSHLDNLGKENKQLKQKLDKIERENRDLKKSIYDLTIKYHMATAGGGHAGAGHHNHVRPKAFNVDHALLPDSPLPESPVLTTEHPHPAPAPAASAAMKHHLASTDDSPSERKGRGREDLRRFQSKHTFKGHTGAVYCVGFAPSGRLLASGSFDKSVRLWDLTQQKEVACLAEHQLNISDLAWASDSSELLSAGFDSVAKLWDVNKAESIRTFAATGFLQAVQFNPTDKNLVFVGSTSKQVLMFDKRQNEPVLTFANDAMVNTIYVYKDGEFFLSGDSEGNIKLWDTKSPNAPIDKVENEEGHKPISHIHLSSTQASEEEGHYLAVNSFDNVLRVYDRGSGIIGGGKEAAERPLGSKLKLVSSLTGHKNHNWPIKSAFHVGKDYGRASFKPASDFDIPTTEASEDPSDKKHSQREKSVTDRLMLATGSADNHAYLFDLGLRNEVTGELVQKLEGHTGRVYAVNFHPSEPLLASASADHSIKLWCPKSVPRGY
jgi:COMPASS component SWD3